MEIKGPLGFVQELILAACGGICYELLHRLPRKWWKATFEDSGVTLLVRVRQILDQFQRPKQNNKSFGMPTEVDVLFWARMLVVDVFELIR